MYYRKTLLLVLIVVGLLGLWFLPERSAVTATNLTSPSQAKRAMHKLPVPLTGELIRKGLALLKALPLIEVQARLRFAVRIPGFGIDAAVNVSTESHTEREVEARLKSETNDILKQQLNVLRLQLKEQQQRNKLLDEQNRLFTRLIDQQVRVFEYQKTREESAILRKGMYQVPADKLVVVVADFSSGNPDQGKEIGDEIAHHLHELTRYGIDVHVLHGEVKDGRVIRNEEMARDVGQHLPPGTDYVVIWGTMSPRTVGQYRPYLTCVQASHGQMASVSYSFNLDSVALPKKDESEVYQRECYQQLIGVTCAAIPGVFAAREINRDRLPRLGKFYEFIGNDKEETKDFQAKLKPFTQWPRAKELAKITRVRRMSETSSEKPFPSTIVNEVDNSVMTLITDAKGQPKRFVDKGEEYIVYMDVLETTSGQFVKFLNEKGGIKQEGGAPWAKIEPAWTSLEENKGTFSTSKYQHHPIENVNWFGARAYCAWAGKSLPTENEWLSAASPDGERRYPWGTTTEQLDKMCNTGKHYGHGVGGRTAKDRSHINCLDMAGNMAEWCENWFDDKDPTSKRAVRGGSFNDTADPKAFEIASRRGLDQITHYRWVGFRGVVRISVKE